MSAEVLLRDLQARDIRIWVEHDRLRLNAPKDVMTDELRAAIAARREELIGLLTRDAGERPQAAAPPDPNESRPLSFAQERMWLVHQLLHGSSYHIPIIEPIDQPVDVVLLEGALAHVVQRHDTLRTSFHLDDGVPVQRVAPSVPVSIDVLDLSGADAATVMRRIDELTVQPFDLTRAPLLHATLLRVDEVRSGLVVVMHHIIADGWSVGVFSRELTEAYLALAEGRAPDLPVLRAQYSDYVAWQRDLVRGGRLDAGLEHWKRRLRGCPTTLDLPMDRPRPAAPTTAGASRMWSLGADASRRVHAACAALGVTPFMFLLAVFDALLFRYTGQGSILVGTAVSSRPRPEFEPLIGLMVNTLVLRADVSRDQSVRDLVAHVRETVLDAHAHAEVPFEKIVEAVRPDRTLSHTPLFQVAFVYQPTAVEARPYTPCGGAMFDLTLFVGESDSRVISTRFEYSTELFDAETIERMAEHFAELVNGFTTDAGARIGGLPIMPAREALRVLREWNDTAREYPRGRSVHDVIDERAVAAPDRVAVRCGSDALTYDDLRLRSDRVAQRLRERGVGPGDRVAVCLDRSVAMPVALLGVLKAGAAYVPLDPQFPAARLAWMMNDAGVRALLTEASLHDAIDPGPVPVIDVDRDEPRTPVTNDAPPVIDAGSLAYVIYTSGSTGQPKGVQVSHRSVQNFLHSMQRDLGITERDRLLAVTTICFDIAGLEIFLPLVAGAEVVIAPRPVTADGLALARLMDYAGATVMQATPATWRMLLDAGWEGRPDLRILCGGEAMSRDLARRLLATGSEVWNLYGPTETTIWSTMARVEDGDGPVPIGRPIANTTVYVLDEGRQPVPPGVAGECFIGGDGVAAGYLGRPELTAERFVPDPFSDRPGARLYRTGDLVRYRADGALEYLGRLDHQLKIRGYRIEPGEIEAALAGHPSVKECAVVGLADPSGGEYLAGYVVARNEATPSLGDELRRFLEQSLPAYMVPTSFVFLPAMPLSPNGKLDRKALPAPARRRAGHVVPRNPLEAELVRAWEEALGVHGIGVTDNFFDLGGHSLLAAKIFSRLERSVGTAPLSLLFEAPTIEKLAARLANGFSGAWQTLVPIQPSGSRPPLFMVHGLRGNVIWFAPLAKALGDDQPFYGLQPVGLDGVTRPLESIVEMARTYLAEIRTVQAHGPYFLGGQCLGGVIAYEMAQQLRAAGETVGGLMLVETWPPSRHPRAELEFSRAGMLWKYLRRRAIAAAELVRSRNYAKLAAVFTDRVRRVTGGAEVHPQDSVFHAEELIRANGRALSRYVPAPYDGDALLVLARDRALHGPDPRMDWIGMVRGQCTLQRVPGSESVELLRPPFVDGVATVIAQYLASVTPER